MRRALLVGVPLFWLVICATCFFGANGMRAPAAILGAVIGSNIIPMIASFIALGTATRAFAASRKPVASLIVITLCSLWAIRSVPAFWSFICRSQQVEAKANLTSLLETGALRDPARRYEYSGDAPDTFRARGIGEMTGDEWIVVDGKPQPVVNICAR